MAPVNRRIRRGHAISTKVPETLSISIEEVMKDLDAGWFIHPVEERRYA